MHFYTNNEISERENIYPIIITLKIKYPGINLTKDVKDLNAKNYQTLIKKTEDDSKNEKIIHAHGLEELMLYKWLYY